MTKGTGLLREQNKRKVLSLIRQLKRSSRQDLAEQMNVSKNTVSLIVENFISEQVLKEVGIKESGTKGRPKVLIEMNENALKSIGFVISENNIEYSVINYYGQVLEKQVISLDGRDPDKTKMKLYSTIKFLLDKYDKVLGVGIGIPGIVNMESRTVYESTHLGWKNVSFKDENFEQLEVPLFVQNSVKMGALYAIEKENCQESRSSFYVRVGEGVGGAYIIDNNIMNGGSWTAGEIGHISIDPNGALCDCGQRGCLELLINTRVFHEKMASLGLPASIESIQESYRGETLLSIKEIVEGFGEYLGKALVQIIHLINPDQILIDTPYNKFKEFTSNCTDYMKTNALQIPYQQTKVVFGKERYNLSMGAALAVIVNYENIVF